MTERGSRSSSVAALMLLAALAPGAEPAAAARGPTGVTWQEPVTVAAGNAFRGPWRMNESTFDFVDDPTVALLPGGDAAVAWVDQARKAVLFQRFDTDGRPRLSVPAEVSRSPRVFSWMPRLAVDVDDPGTFYVAWQEIVFSGGSHGGEIFFARSTDGGRSFGAPVNLSRTEHGAGKGRLTRNYWHNGSLDLAAGPGDTLYVAWTEYEGPLRLARSIDGGRSFGETLRIAGGPGEPPARGPALAVGADGAVHLAWTVGGDVHADIRYARSDDGGETFGVPVRVGAGRGHADAPKLAVDPDGTLHLAWADSPSGPVGHYEIRYAHRAPGAPGFAPPRTISTPLPAGVVGAGFPHLAIAGRRQVVVVSELFREQTRRHPLGLALMHSRDGGETFAAPAVIPGTADPEAGFNGSQQGLLMRKLDAAPGGVVAVVNSRFRPGVASRVRLYRAAIRPGAVGADGHSARR